MRRKWFCYLISGLIAIFMISCGDSDDEADEPTARTVTPTTPTTPEETSEEPEVEINFAAEAAQVRANVANFDRLVNAREANEVMELFLDSGVTMAHSFFGAPKISEGRNEITTTWKTLLRDRLQWPLATTVEEVGIDDRAKRATVTGRFTGIINETRPYVAELGKDSDDRWKFKKVDFGDLGIVKNIIPPR